MPAARRARLTLSLTLVLVAIDAGFALQARRASIVVAPKLLSLRGGAQPAAVERTATLPKRAPSASRSRTLPIKRQNSSKSGFGMRDAAVVILCLLAAAAAHLYAEPLIGTVAPNLKEYAWVAFGGTFATGLYTMARLVNYNRVHGIDRALCKLLVGIEPLGLGSLLPPALFFALGSAASVQTLPSHAG